MKSLPALAFLLASCVIPANKAPFEPATTEASNARTVGVFIFDGVFNTELVAPLDVFQHAGALAEQWGVEPPIRVITIGPTLEPITTAEGLRIKPNHGFDDAPAVEIFVVPSGQRFDLDMQNREWTAWIASMSQHAQYTMGHGWGSFLLAAAGRLEGKKVATFPADTEKLQATFAGVHAVKNVRFVHDGTTITSSAGLASYEASLYLVNLLYGEKLAKSVAAGLVFAPENLENSFPKKK